MSEPSFITPSGGNLILHHSDGSRQIALRTSTDLWMLGGLFIGKPALAVSTVTHNSARATATKGDGEAPAGWSFQRSTNTNFDPANVSSINPWNMTGLAPETQYYVRVRATLDDMVSEWSDVKTFTTSAAPVDPSEGFRWPFPPNEIGTEWEGYVGHKGVDWPRADGTPILVAQAGVVEMSGWTGTQGDWASGWGWGNKVVVNHGAIGQGGAVLRTLYAHMNATPPVSVGQSVAKGDVIGYVGTTGDSTGNHLHWETSVNGMYSQINPRTFMSQYGE